MQTYRPPIIAEAMRICRACPVPIVHLENAAGLSRGAFHRWGQETGNGATVGCLDAMLKAAGYELKIVKTGAL